MNTTLREAEFCDPAGVRRKFEVFFVPKRLIRYVQIPTEIDIKSSLEKLFSKYKKLGFYKLGKIQFENLFICLCIGVHFYFQL